MHIHIYSQPNARAITRFFVCVYIYVYVCMYIYTHKHTHLSYIQSIQRTGDKKTRKSGAARCGGGRGGGQPAGGVTLRGGGAHVGMEQRGYGCCVCAACVEDTTGEP
jgi:hypothetical protein